MRVLIGGICPRWAYRQWWWWEEIIFYVELSLHCYYKNCFLSVKDVSFHLVVSHEKDILSLFPSVLMHNLVWALTPIPPKFTLSFFLFASELPTTPCTFSGPIMGYIYNCMYIPVTALPYGKDCYTVLQQIFTHLRNAMCNRPSQKESWSYLKCS